MYQPRRDREVGEQRAHVPGERGTSTVLERERQPRRRTAVDHETARATEASQLRAERARRRGGGARGAAPLAPVTRDHSDAAGARRAQVRVRGGSARDAGQRREQLGEHRSGSIDIAEDTPYGRTMPLLLARPGRADTAAALLSAAVLAAAVVVALVRPAGEATAGAATARYARGITVLATHQWGGGALVLGARGPAIDRHLVLAFVIDRGRGWSVAAAAEQSTAATDVQVGSLLHTRSRGGSGQPPWTAVYGEIGDTRITQVVIGWDDGTSSQSKATSAYLIVREGTHTPMQARYLAADGAEIALVPIS